MHVDSFSEHQRNKLESTCLKHLRKTKIVVKGALVYVVGVSSAGVLPISKPVHAAGKFCLRN
jgi:hypothetical protein